MIKGPVPKSQHTYTAEKLLEPIQPAFNPENSTEKAVYDHYHAMGRMAWELNEKYHEANYDELTGLLRKEAFMKDLERRVQAGKPFGLIFIDLDKFKRVNDKLGHQVGDGLLRRFGARLQNRFQRASDASTYEQRTAEENNDSSTGRYGGDEFMIAIDLAGNGNREKLSPQKYLAKEVAYTQGVVEEFVAQQPEAIRKLKFNASVGSAIWEPGPNAPPVSGLIHQADQSMFANKPEPRSAA